MATTTNYGWTTPDDTALVKDGAAAIRTLGSSVDTTTKNLNPSTTLGDIEYRSSSANTNTRLGIGTSGQSLQVVAGVPSWAASATSVLTTTGDILYASAANTLERLGVGSTGQVLTVAGGLPSWATAGASPNYQLINAGGTALTGATTITVSGISGKNELFIFVADASTANDSSAISLRLNADSGANYGYANVQRLSSTSADSDGSLLDQSRFTVSTLTSSNNTSTTIAYIHIFGCNSAGFKIAHINSWAAGTGSRALASMGAYEGTSTISSISLLSSSGNFDAGTLYVYGA
jgi:hypothetical protein